MLLRRFLFLFFGLSLVSAQATQSTDSQREDATKIVLVDTKLATQLGLDVVQSDPVIKVSAVKLKDDQRDKLIELAHKNGKCGGFEVLSSENYPTPESHDLRKILDNLRTRYLLEEKASTHKIQRKLELSKKSSVQQAIDQVDPERLRASVFQLQSYGSRHHESETPNDHVEDLKDELGNLMSASNQQYKIDLIEHSSTEQKTVRLRIVGSHRPDEILVFGAHFDSISGFWGGGEAPGADDDASGSANLIEMARILSQLDRPKRSIEFFWYAAEEVGLLGSADIAERYKQEKRDVIGVMQLDMTLQPGSGEFVIGNIADYTNSWLRSYLQEINDLYTQVRMVEDKCGYGCSDHASWFRQGFATVMPFESRVSDRNGRIHTSRDRINDLSSFEHSAVFSKLGLAFALHLANSEDRPQSTLAL